MTLIADALATTKKILLVSEELDWLSDDVESLARTVADHERRLIRMETVIEIAQSGARITLPGR